MASLRPVVDLLAGSDFAPYAGVEVGKRLSKARQQRNLTLADIARSTKIPLHVLEAIERDDVDRMPHGLFARAFVRTYASEVGVNPGELVDTFDQPEAAPPDVQAPVDGPASMRWMYFVIPVVLLVCMLFYTGFAPTNVRSEAQRAAAEVPIAAADRIEPAAAVVPPATSDVELQIQSSGGCIVAVTADGHPTPWQATAGEPVVLKARGEVVLRVGDASVCAPAVKAIATPKPARRGRVDPAPQTRVGVERKMDQQTEGTGPRSESAPDAPDDALIQPDQPSPPAATEQF